MGGKMKSCANLTSLIEGEALDMGWLDGVTCLETAKAVRTDWHSHGYMELIGCLRGEFDYEFENGQTATLGAGTCICIPAGERHRIKGAIDSPGRRVGLAVLEKPAQRRKFALFTAEDFGIFVEGLNAKKCRTIACPADVTGHFRELSNFAKRERGEIGRHEWGMVRIACCSILVGVYAAKDPEGEAPRPYLMAEAVKYIREHARERFELGKLVTYVGFSRAHFFDLFKQHTGLTPHDYLLRHRVELAKAELAAKPEAGMAQVGKSCGFADAGAFTKVFKRYTGFTPGAYRNQTRNGKQGEAK